MNILVWHVHGGYLNSLVQGGHRYLLPTSQGQGGRGQRDWPDSAVDVDDAELHRTDVDLVVLQRTEELELAAELLGRVPGRDVPALFLEHNTPKGNVPNALHPLAEQSDIPVVHVTHFNQLFWDSGRAPTTVVEHGIVDPGPLYTGELAALAVVINEPVRRWRVTGTDLLPAFAQVAPVDAFGIAGEALEKQLGLAGQLRFGGDLPTAELHAALARRRVYLHPVRWTSLGLSLLEAMHLGMPVVALASTEAARAVPPEAGAISTDLAELLAAARHLVDDPDEARSRGAVAREVALERYGIERFLRHWDEVFADTVSAWHGRGPHRTASASSAPCSAAT